MICELHDRDVMKRHAELVGRVWRHAIAWSSAALAMLITFNPVPLNAQSAASGPNILQGVRIEQKLNQQVPLDLPFYDENGKAVKLGDYFGQKPVVLSLVYYECPMLCTEVLNGMLHTFRALKFNIGDQFNVVTVSFNPLEKPGLAMAKKRVYVGLYGRPGASEGWHFLTGDEPAIEQLARAVGFHYKYDPTTGQYAHATGIMVLTPDGRISKYFYGIEYKEIDLRLGLMEAANRRIGSPVDEVLLFCCQYDPMTGKYGLVISRVIKVAGSATVLCLGIFIFILFRFERRRMRQQGLAPGAGKG